MAITRQQGVISNRSLEWSPMELVHHCTTIRPCGFKYNYIFINQHRQW